jgi:hypothetical protein
VKKFEIKKRGDELIVEFKKQKEAFAIIFLFMIAFIIFGYVILLSIFPDSPKSEIVVYLSIFILLNITIASLLSWNTLSQRVLKVDLAGVTFHKKLFRFEKLYRFKWRDIEKFELKTITHNSNDIHKRSISYFLNLKTKGKDFYLFQSDKDEIDELIKELENFREKINPQ